jgi:hypothetical protein
MSSLATDECVVNKNITEFQHLKDELRVAMETEAKARADFDSATAKLMKDESWGVSGRTDRACLLTWFAKTASFSDI